MCLEARNNTPLLVVVTVLTPYHVLCLHVSCVDSVLELPAQIVIVASGLVDTTDVSGVLPNDDGAPPIEVFLRPTEFTDVDAAVRDFAHGFDRALSRGRLEGLHALMGGIRERVDYNGGVTDALSTASEVLKAGVGVCQDYAHLFIACCRALGVPARYVSGYLLTRPPEGKPRLVGADASHAWVSVWVPRTGWVDLDPTNNLLPGEQHVTVAWGRDYGDVSPINGIVIGGGSHSVDVAVDVTPAAA